MQTNKSKSTFSTWLNERLPVQAFWQRHIVNYFAPKNFNFWYFFGSLALFLIVNQIVTGIWLTMYYTPTAEGAFASIEYIMRDVNYGWLLRYMHSTGASAFFIVIYLHIFRSLLYGSHKKPRELIWLFGVVLYISLLAEAFMGYLLPWGQMSYWAAQVITSLFTAIPYIGNDLTTWIRGDYAVSGVTLGRFFALHIIAMPLFILLLIGLHISSLHKVGSNNPAGIEINKHKDQNGKPLDGIPFHPYYTVKDFWGLSVFLLLFSCVIFFAPTLGGYFLEHANFSPANSMQTPSLIAPVWYMTPFYAMLRAVPNKLMGVIVLFAAIFILFFLPWLDRSKVKSLRYRGSYSKIALTIFVISFGSLIYLGIQEVTTIKKVLAQIFTVLYFAFFLLMPIYTRYEKTKPVPERLP
jgi:ubiquinol-cytochrome c reductase cytochrome b subunit